MHTTAGTLGQVIYGKLSASPGPENEWAQLIERIAAEDADGLLSLYDRTAGAVYTLLVRLTLDRQMAEALLLEVYADLRRYALEYSPAESTVLAWIMRRARGAAIEQLRAEWTRNHGEAQSVAGLIPIDMPDYRHIVRFREEEKRFADALAGLAPNERQAIEAVYFDKRPPQPVAADLRNGMRKLAGTLALSQPTRAEARAAPCEDADRVHAHALHALPPDEAKDVEAHRTLCSPCGGEFEAVRPVLKQFLYWPRDLLRPPPALREGLLARIGKEAGMHAAEDRWTEPPWAAVAAGISCKLLAADPERGRLSMLVRLVPGGEYPPHTHAEAEELHLLHGDLWIDDRKIHAGDYNRAERGTVDKRVWSETGCTCVLVTNSRDILN